MAIIAVAPLNFGNGQEIAQHILWWMLLFIHAGINTKPCQNKWCSNMNLRVCVLLIIYCIFQLNQTNDFDVARAETVMGKKLICQVKVHLMLLQQLIALSFINFEAYR